MMRLPRRSEGLYLVLCLLLWSAGARASEPPAGDGVRMVPLHATLLQASTTKPFEDVREEIEFAITERNFRITGRNTIGAALRKRGFPDFPDVEVIHFCNLQNARKVLLLDPGFVAQMPCRITLHEQNGRVIISAILLPEDNPDERVNAFARRLNRQLREIVDFALYGS